MCLTSVDQLVTLKVLLELLDNLDAHLQVMGAVRIDQLADLLTLVWALFDKCTIVSEQVLAEEFVKFVSRCILIVIDLHCQLLAEHERVREATIYGRETSQHHGQERIESCHLCARLE